MAKAGTKPKPLTKAQKNRIAKYVIANAGAQTTGQPSIATAKSIYGKDYTHHLSGRQIYNDPTELARVLGGTGQGKTLDELLRNITQGYESAGVEQFRLNKAGKTGVVQKNPFLQNVDPNFDVNSLLTVLGEANAMEQSGHVANLANLWKQRTNPTAEVGGGQYLGVPTGMKNAFDTLTQGGTDLLGQIRGAEKTGGGLGMTLEQVMSPEINLYDPSKPFFQPSESGGPASLWQLTGGGSGEQGFLSTLDLEEYLKQIQPNYNREFNRGPGQPVPADLGGGPMFGGYNEATGDIGGWMRNTDAYKRWTALGMPGDPSMGGYLADNTGWWNPLLGTHGTMPTSYAAKRMGLAGSVQPNYFGGGAQAYKDFIINNLGIIGAAGFLNDPSIYFQGANAQYNPANLDPATLARLLAVLQQTPYTGSLPVG